MEQHQWIQKVLNSTNGMTTVVPGDDLFFAIQQKIQQQNRVSSKTVWLAAASIAVLVVLNITILKTKTKQTATNGTTTYLEMTVNQSNQLYQ